MKLLVIATLSLLVIGGNAFPQGDKVESTSTESPKNETVIEETKTDLNSTETTTTAAPTTNSTSAPQGEQPKPPPEFGPEARSDTFNPKPKVNFKGKPLAKPLPKSKRKKLTFPKFSISRSKQTPVNPKAHAHPKAPVPPKNQAQQKVRAQQKAQVPPKVQPQQKAPALPKAPAAEAQRRDSPAYGLPPVFGSEVIIEQAGPSQEYGWVGHGSYAPHNIPNPFPSSLPKWILENNKIFEAGLLYPAKPGAAPSYAPPPPPPAEQPTYTPVAAPPAPESTYTAPSSYNVPVIPSSASYNSVSVPAEPSYSADPSPVYVAPAEAPVSYEPTAPLPVYNEVPIASAPISPNYNLAEQASSTYGVIPAGSAFGSAVVSASYSSVDSQPSSEYVAAVPASYDAPQPTYQAAEPAYDAPQPTYEVAAPAYDAPAGYEAVVPQPSYNIADFPPPFYGTTFAPSGSYEAAPLDYRAAAPPQPTYENSAPPLNVYDAPAPAQESYEAQQTYGVPEYNAAAQPVENYGAPEPAATTPQPTYIAQPVQVDYNAPAQDDQSLYNLYKSPAPVEQPAYQQSADNSYAVPSISPPGNFPTYNNIAPSDEYVQPLDAPQDIYDVPIKVEETFEAQGDAKSPEVFYIFYENQEPAAAAQNEQGYVVPPPEGAGFNPPKDIQTIYVPPENAINIPNNYGVDVGSSFGYDAPQQLEQTGFPEYDDSQVSIASNNGFSFDNPAFNTPKSPIGDTLFRGTVEKGLRDPINKFPINDGLFQEDLQNHSPNPIRPIRELLKKPVPVDDSLTDDTSNIHDHSKGEATLPFGARLKKTQDKGL